MYNAVTRVSSPTIDSAALTATSSSSVVNTGVTISKTAVFTHGRIL